MMPHPICCFFFLFFPTLCFFQSFWNQLLQIIQIYFAFTVRFQMPSKLLAQNNESSHLQHFFFFFFLIFLLSPAVRFQMLSKFPTQNKASSHLFLSLFVSTAFSKRFQKPVAPNNVKFSLNPLCVSKCLLKLLSQNNESSHWF